MRVVYRYPFFSTTPMHVPGGRVVHVGVNRNASEFPCVWIEHEADPPSDRRLRLQFFGTGHPIHEGAGTHVGSVETPVGLVWHVYAGEVE